MVLETKTNYFKRLGHGISIFLHVKEIVQFFLIPNTFGIW